MRLIFKNADALKLIARFVAIYGPTRVEDAGQRALLVREYVEQLGPYEPRNVQAAASALIRTSKFWPTVSELLEVIHAQAREASGHPDRAHWTGEDDGDWKPPTPEELARVTDAVDKYLKRAKPSAVRKNGPEWGDAEYEKDAEEFLSKRARAVVAGLED